MRVIAFTSQSGGTGKTCLAVHFAASLFKKGKNVALCDLSAISLAPIYFGGTLASPTQNTEITGKQALQGLPKSAKQLESHQLHASFSLIMGKENGEADASTLLDQSMQLVRKTMGAEATIIVDLPRESRLTLKEKQIDFELEVISSDPTCLATLCQTLPKMRENMGRSECAKHKFFVLNKKDLRSYMSVNAANLATRLLDSQLLGTLHYDTAVIEAFAHKMLLSEYAPQSPIIDDLDSLVDTLEEIMSFDPAFPPLSSEKSINFTRTAT